MTNGRNLVDTLRHQNEFDLGLLEKLRFDVIGCGATGLRVALELAGLGVQNLHLWDFDLIEPHNIANQIYAYGLPDVGRPKAEVLAELIERRTGLRPTVHLEACDGSKKLGQVVFLLTDTMASRKEIWHKAVRRKFGVKLMIETRLDAWEYQLFTIDPHDSAHIKGWEENSAYGDEEERVEPGVCRAQTTIGGTADHLCGASMNQLLRWLKAESGMAENDRIEQSRNVCARSGKPMSAFYKDLYGVGKAA